MDASRRALGLICYVAVAVWIGVYLAWQPVRDARLAPEAPRTARVQPRPEPPPAAPAPPAEPAPTPPAAEPEPTPVGREEIAAGAQLLDGGGEFPALNCSYEDFPSFAAYARAMALLGARFVVVRNREIVAGVDVQSGVFRESDVDGKFSPRARNYTDEPALAPLTRAVRERFGEGAVVMMLVPRTLDAGLFGGIARALSDRGNRHADFREIRGRYQRAAGGGVRLRVDSAVRLDGTPTPIDLVFDLGAIARSEAGAA